MIRPTSDCLTSDIVYKCQKQDDQCNFFLWDDDAKSREEHALLSTSRTEPLYANRVTSPKSQNAPEPPPPYTPGIILEKYRKRPQDITEEGDEFALGNEEDEDFVRELDQAMIATETPRKAARTEAFRTPRRRKLPWVKDNESGHGLQTPQTGRRAVEDLSRTRFATPRYEEPENGTHHTLTPESSPFNTPTPSRFKDVGAKEDLVREVFSLLRDNNVSLSSQVETELRDVLLRHTRKAEGFRKGQELMRLSVKTKEARISELEYRIHLLENGQGDHSNR